MKEKDNGISDIQTENSNINVSAKELESKFDLIEKISEKTIEMSNKKDEEQRKKTEDQIKNSIEQREDIALINGKNKIKNGKLLIINENSNNKEIKSERNQLKSKNCINKIDLDKNIIVLNKKNLKELNASNKEINKKSQTAQKKGEIINIFGNNKFYYTNKDINNTISKSYDIYTKKIEYSYENSGNIKYNLNFPNEIIEKFFERKKNKKKENKDNIPLNLFGDNPLERLKEIQEKLNDSPPTSKNSKISVKQFKINQKKLKEEDYKIQNYIKLFPVFNSPEHKIFKFNQFYYYNRIYDDKNNYYNKKSKNRDNKNKIKEEIEKEKEESEDDTIKRHIKKKFINKKRNKSKNKGNKNYSEA